MDRAILLTVALAMPAFLAACDAGSQPGLATPADPEWVRLAEASEATLDALLTDELVAHGFTGRIQETARGIGGGEFDPDLQEAGRLLFFDPVTSLTGDNTCSGCHAPSASFGGTQSIAIGVENNGIVGPGRQGPRNMRRSPTVVNSALFPRLMLNSRFEALSGDPFDNTAGFFLLAPEGLSLSHLPHLLAAQAFMPVVDRSEMAGFHFVGTRDEMRAELARRVDGIAEYRALFSAVFPDIAAGAPITFEHIGLALAEFQASLIFADAPVDAFARGNRKAMNATQKRGALLFFGKAGCVECHAVDVPFASGDEMFTDYQHYVIGVPQIVPAVHNVEFAGPGANEDFGREDFTGDPADRYAFRTSPLRNVALQPWFMHDGVFNRLEDAIEHHLDAFASASSFTPDHLAPDLRTLGPLQPILERLDPRIADPPELTPEEAADLTAFVRCGLLDRDAIPQRMRRLTPRDVPSGLPVHAFQFGSSGSLLAACSGS